MTIMLKETDAVVIGVGWTGSILARELTNSCGEPFVQPSLFYPPGIETERVGAGHPARTGQQAQITSEVTSRLPECRPMEIQSGPIRQRTKIDIHRTSETVPACKSLFLFALDVRQRIADILKIESDSSFPQT